MNKGAKARSECELLQVHLPARRGCGVPPESVHLLRQLAVVESRDARVYIEILLDHYRLGLLLEVVDGGHEPLEHTPMRAGASRYALLHRSIDATRMQRMNCLICELGRV